MLLDSARVEKETTQAGKLSAVSFPSTGGAGVSTLTLGAIFLASSAELLRALRSKALNRKERRETRAKFAKKTAHRRRSQGMPKGCGGRKLLFDYRTADE